MMLKWDLVKLVGSTLLGGVAMLLVLPACGGSAGQTASIPTAPRTTAPTTSSTGSSNSDLLAQGKLIFEKTAGGVGCAYCHGLDGKGGGVSGLGAPNIRGAKDAEVRGALIGGVPYMSFIKLSDAEITAVVAYLQYLNEQP